MVCRRPTDPQRQPRDSGWASLARPWRRLRHAGLIALLLLPGHALQAGADSSTELLPYQARYSAVINGLSVTATRQLQRTSNAHQWLLQTEARVLFIGLEEQATFLLEGGQLQPQHYRYIRHGLSDKRNLDLLYDREQGVLSNRAGEAWSHPLSADLRDPLTTITQLRVELLQRGITPRIVDIPVISGSRIRDYQFEILGEELIETPAGSFNCIKIRRFREQSPREDTLWLATDWNYLLVALRHLDEEDEQWLQLKSASVDGVAVTPLAE